MARNISFMLTTEQIKNRTKTVTRRAGWKFVKVGDILHGCEKCQGLKAGEKIKKLCKIRVTSVRFEPLRAMTDNPSYGFEETALEGFPSGSLNYPSNFVRFFCDSHKGITPDSEVTRIEFEYLADLALESVRAGAGRRKHEIQPPLPLE
jgi:hypothetical protein